MSVKYFKKAVAVTLSVLILFGCSLTGCLTAFAAPDSSHVQTMGEYSQQYPKAYSAIVNGIENLEEEIDIRAANVPVTNAEGEKIIEYIFREVLENNPRLFYVSPRYGCSSNGSIVLKLHLSYAADAQTLIGMKAAFEASAQRYLSLVSDEMTDCEKALVLHDAIALNCMFDTDDVIEDDALSAYGVFCNGVAVCQGYAYAYKYLLDKIGIESYIVTSEQMNHAWNLLKIDNSYYHVDITWDDPYSDKTGRVNHKYFLLSDSYIQTESDGFRPHYAYYSMYDAASDAYDGYFWSNVASMFNYNDGIWYYSDKNGNIWTGSTENMQERVLLTVTDKWYVGNSSSYYYDKYVKTSFHNGYLYYNTPENVYKVNPNNISEAEVVYSDNADDDVHIFGIAKMPDGGLYASMLSDYSAFDNVVKLFDMPTEEITVPSSSETEPTESTAEATSTAPVTEPTESTAEATTTEPVTEPTESTAEVTTTEPVTEPTESTAEATSTAPVTEPTESTAEVTTTAPVTEPTESTAEVTTTEPATEPTESTAEVTTTAPVTEPTESTAEVTTTEPATEPTESTAEATSTAPVTEPAESTAEATTTEPVTEPTESTAEATTTLPVTEPTESTAEATTTEPEETKIILGDVNNDGKINIKDATVVQMYVASLVELDENQRIAADVTGDGKIKINDATDIQKFVASIIVDFTC